MITLLLSLLSSANARETRELDFNLQEVSETCLSMIPDLPFCDRVVKRFYQLDSIMCGGGLNLNFFLNAEVCRAHSAWLAAINSRSEALILEMRDRYEGIRRIAEEDVDEVKVIGDIVDHHHQDAI